LVSLGRAKRALGEVDQAARYARDGLDLFRKLGHILGIAAALEEVGFVSEAQGETARSVALFSASHAIRERIGAPLPPVDRKAYDATNAACCAKLGETAFSAAWAGASARSYQEVVEEILDDQKNYPDLSRPFD
jgi:hypothetical protein